MVSDHASRKPTARMICAFELNGSASHTAGADRPSKDEWLLADDIDVNYMAVAVNR